MLGLITLMTGPAWRVGLNSSRMVVNKCALLRSATGQAKLGPLHSLLILTTLRGLFIIPSAAGGKWALPISFGTPKILRQETL